jgi:thioredoxin 1
MEQDIKSGRVLIDFYANWCGPCKLMKPQLKKFEEEQDEVKVVMVHVEENFELASTYNVRNIPTLVYLEEGEIVARDTGAKNLQQIKEFTNVA